MCRKAIYYNTYADGSKDVTERVDTCQPATMCAQPDVREYYRNHRLGRLSQSAPDAPYTSEYYQQNLFPPTPPRQSKSPSPSRWQDTPVFVNDYRTSSMPKRRHSTTARDIPEGRRGRDRVVVVPQEAPSTPPSRHSRHFGARPEVVVVEGSRNHRHAPRYVPPSPVIVGDDLNRYPPSPPRPSPLRRTGSHHHHRPHRSVSPADVVIHTDDERPERRHQRKHRRASMYASGAAGSDHTQNSAASEPLFLRKELRWEDELEAQRLAQNERIARRQKPRQEVKGILKNPGSSADHARADADLRRAVENLDIRGTSSGHREERAARREPHRRDPEEEMYFDRLRERFEEPRERRRRSKVYYSGDGFYKYN